MISGKIYRDLPFGLPISLASWPHQRVGGDAHRAVRLGLSWPWLVRSGSTAASAPSLHLDQRGDSVRLFHLRSHSYNSADSYAYLIPTYT